MPDEEERDALQNLELDVFISAEADEQWSYVYKKKNRRWLWYIIEKTTRKVIAFIFGPRTDEVYQKLVNLLPEKLIDILYTDNRGSYSKIKFAPIHVIGKINTKRIERKNLDLRTRVKRLNRKTICFSKSEIIHDAVIGSFIMNHMF